ncbi:hypothetical protein NDA03_18910 [Trichocoleus sp. Lan]|uniref:hypothetical protein n=1 Tax=Trichocoleus sp. Lan TaxID=2933927 RepID=UPI003298A032
MQETELPYQVNDQRQQVERLNNLDSQAWLYLGVLERLGTRKAESHERIAKTIEALRQKKGEIQDELKPRRPEKYHALEKLKARTQDIFAFIPSIQAKRDFEHIEKIINELILSNKNKQPSKTVIQDVLEELSLRTSRNASKISPARLGLVYRVEELLYSISQKQISNLNRSELDELNEKFVNELKDQRDILSKEFNKLLSDKYAKQQELEIYSIKLDNLNKEIAERESALSRLQGKIEKYIQLEQVNQNKINNLNSKLNELNRKLLELEAQKKTWTAQKSRLIQDLNQEQQNVNKLNTQLSKYSQIRIMNGKYIGNLSDKSSKYHFEQKCNHWKMLVGDYVLRLDDSRQIVSSSTPTVFLREGLGECEVCSGRKSLRRRRA